MAAAGAFNEQTTQPPREPRFAAPSRRFWLGIGLLWLATALFLLATRAYAIAHHDFLDVDDQLRLVEVRDWLAGQSFYDVIQHRLNAPFGAAMHWSRLVDMPLALVILALRPLIGAAAAETVAAVAVPLATLGVIMAATGAIAYRLGGARTGLVATGFCALCLPMTQQITPLRVDHHGWEIALQALALMAALGPDPRRTGRLAGCALAVALQISLEPLPFAAALGGVFGFWWALDPAPAQRKRLSAFLVTLSAVEVVLYGLLHAPSAWGVGYCDAVSPPHLLLLAVSAAGVVALIWTNPRRLVVRLAGLGAAALCAAAAGRAYPPHCGLDAFSNLEPIVRTMWYDRVLEGLPFWRLPPVLASSTIGFPVVAVAYATYAAWCHDGDRRAAWTVYAVLLGAATLAAMLVQRAGGFASVAATPAAAWMLCRFLQKALRSGSMLIRVFGAASACFAFSPIAVVAAVAMIAPADPDVVQRTAVAGRACSASEHIAGLAALPTSRLLAPLDLGPAILLDTPHSPLASGHHRNHVAMAQVITAFTGPDETARRIVAERGVRFVVLCPGGSEIKLYRRTAPDGFASHLVAGRAPAWLQPVRLPGDPIMVWRVRG